MIRVKVSICCLACKKIFLTKPSKTRRKYCSPPCYRVGRKAHPELRFWQNVDMMGECWTWQGERRQRGYGAFYTMRNGVKFVAAHRYAFELCYGPIPNGLLILHRCDNPPCVRPDHLYAGTQADNMRDRKHRTGFPVGSAHYMAKLTEETVRKIRKLHASGVSQNGLAKRFNSDQTNISMIVNRKTWKHI